MIKTIIVEDEPLFRELLRRSLSAVPHFRIVGEAGDGLEAIRLSEQTEPDVLVVDIELPGSVDGVEVAVRVKARRPQTGVVFLSSHSDPRFVSGLPLRKTGGWAYLLKQTASGLAAVVDAIERTKAGLIVLDPDIVAKLRVTQESMIGSLSPSKLAVLKLIAQGYSNSMIAERLNLSPKSVENYINAIYQELQLTGIAEIHARVKATLLYLESS